MWSLGSTRIEVFSPLSPAECFTRLDAELGMYGNKAVAGKVRRDSLRLRERIWYRNSFQTFLFAKLVPQAQGTLIVGRLGMHWLVLTFMAVWLGGALSFAVGWLLASLRGDAVGGPPFAILVFFPVFGVALCGFGRFLARHEAQFLTYFLVETVKGQLQEPDSATRIVQDR